MRQTPTWIQTAAWAIHDPVRRLRFLQAVAPRANLAFHDRPSRGRAVRLILIVLLVAAALTPMARPRATQRVAMPVAGPVHDPRPASSVWLVEQTRASEVYSNGLRVDCAAVTANRPRDAAPAGIVYHSSESELAPFEAEHNDVLKRIGESLLDYICRRRAYHFLIDRFGRVFRAVAESDAANHAGHSIWADERSRYIDLNDSFLGIAFEGRGASMTPAQARSGAMLTEMLRARYQIPARNCVTHAQVSVNPSNMRIGYHVDWAAGFPFADLGLPDNYTVEPPAIWAFGFLADAAYRNAAGDELRAAIERAERNRDASAAASGLSPAAYRARLARLYSGLSAGASGKKKNTSPRIR